MKPVEIVHARRVAAPVDDVGLLLDGLGGPDDRLWPTEAWPTTPLTIERPLRVGAVSRQGGFTQVVDEYVPGRRLSFRISPGQPLSGGHRLDVEAEGAAGTRMQHTLMLAAAPWLRPVVPIFLRQHDALVEDLFDRAELATTGGLVRPSRHPRAVRVANAVELRLLRAARAPDRVRRIGVTDPIATARRYDYADAFELRLEGPDRCSPEEWVRAGVDATPAWIKRIAGHAGDGLGSARIVASDAEVVVLEDSDPLMHTVMVGRNVEPEGRVLTTVLRYRRPRLARAVWALVGILHRRTARRLVAGGLRQAGRGGAGEVVGPRGARAQAGTSSAPALGSARESS